MDADDIGRALRHSASDVIGKVEVLEPKIAPSPITASALAIASALTWRSSNTASTMSSQS